MNTELREFLPLLIPLVIAEFSLLGYTLYHIFSHKTYKHGNRAIWLVVVLLGMNFIGPILYLIIGREEE
ncbi:MAG: PLDc N-terminal domain-containing protein [Ruminococcus sp.]|nr:PLDc N-terminal domain-containing protein [Ruminococcus sp.]